jgi:hypothetical protein
VEWSELSCVVEELSQAGAMLLLLVLGMRCCVLA